MSKLFARLIYCALTLVVSIVNVGTLSAAPRRQVDAGVVSCTVSILPQKYFVERIGGERVVVDVMVGPGQSPATYEPTGRQIAELANSRLYFSIGVAFERALLPRIQRNFEKVDVIDTSKGIVRRSIAGHTHRDGVEGKEPGHIQEDPHIWLSPINAIRIAENIRTALCKHDPAWADEYNRNFDALAADLRETDKLIADILGGHSGQEILVFHPAYGYFTDEYGLAQVPIEVEGGSPGPRHLAGIIDNAKAKSVTTIFVQPQFSSSSAQTIAGTIGAHIETLDPLAENYCENLVVMAKKIAAALPARTAKE